MVPRLRLLFPVAIALFLVAALSPRLAASLGPDRGESLFTSNDLWRVVTYICRPSASLGLSLPCSVVHPGGPGDPGWARLPIGRAHILTVPTKRIRGIESPDLLLPESGAYWQAAWDARSEIEAGLGRKLDRTDVALALNSAFGRSQNQLHIHTGCIRQDVKKALSAEAGTIGAAWVKMRTVLQDVRYSVIRLPGEDLGGTRLFSLLPESARRSPKAMAQQTLVIVGANFETGPGYYILRDQDNRSGSAHGESLLDFACRR